MHAHRQVPTQVHLHTCFQFLLPDPSNCVLVSLPYGLNFFPATTKALEYSTGASMGDNVTVMVESSVATARLLWRRDGVFDPDGSTGSSCRGKTSCGDASASNSSVFESFEAGAYSTQIHAIMNVIVRGERSLWDGDGMWAFVLLSDRGLEQKNFRSSVVISNESPCPRKNSIVWGIVKVRVRGFE
ncbi:hypothetical protein BSL78_16296 [Apostichopus japonicus]|uniref:Uncharacterized protein n=1 Tax=Stichopus japonicus TaxID=307972 RepID=A0A2G8KFR5_STIJA|nr:hypothetical protein BSL78_16296 [Apostichopus japonicus]